jgi:ATP-dependent Clp protease adaptor protein ClpS
MAREEFDELAVAEAEGKTKLQRPPLYKVLLHNDDYTSMEFVVFILQTVFDRTEADAVSIMLNVHRQGIGVAGLYTYEVAEMKVARVAQLAEANEFPLLCTFEEAEEDRV